MKKLFASLLISMLLASTAFALSDVSESTSNATAINFLNQRGIVSGYPDGTYKPENPLNRAELTKILVGATGASPTLDTHNNCFPDVTNEWFAPYVCYAKEKGWVSGYPDGTFQAGKEVNKVEAIKIIVSAQGISTTDANVLSYSDVDKSAWYAPYLAAAHQRGLLETLGGDYGVGLNITRGEVSENIYRSIVVKEEGLPSFLDETDDNSVVSVKVVKVVDGDTIDVDLNGSTARVRLIGIDTPEMTGSSSVANSGVEASDRAKELLLGKTIKLEADATQGDKDKYDRLLRYVFLIDGTNFNQQMIREGYAHEYTYNRAYKYQAAFKAAQVSAKAEGLGVWTDDDADDSDDSDEDESDDSSSDGGYVFYVSSQARTKYYCETDSAWKSLSPANLLRYTSESELKRDFPGLTLNQRC